MARVYLATQSSLARDVAIKVLLDCKDEQYAKRFLHEARTLAAINHPGIITIYDVSRLDDGRPYFAMEYLSGGDLLQLKGQKLDQLVALEYLRQITSALSVIHEKGIVHRDVKPANILFRDDQHVVLSDFGIAKNIQSDSDLTRDGSSVGSPSYSSPEQSTDRALDPRSDLYSLGVVFTEMLLGYNPFVAASMAETVINHLQMDLPILPKGLEGCQALVDGLLAKDPLDRFQTAEELLVAIDNALMYSSRPSKISGLFAFWPQLTVNVTLWLALFGVGVVTAGLWVGFTHKSETEKAVDHLLASANQSLAEAKFEVPVDDSARYYFDQVLLLDPKNKYAISGLESLKLVQIRYYLAQASESLKGERFFLPENNNAEHFYFSVLALDSENAEAKNGLGKLVKVYVDLTLEAFVEKDYQTAFEYLKRGLFLDPSNEILLSLKKEYKHQSNALKRLINKVFK